MRAALHISPDLRALDAASDHRIAARLADALHRRGATASPADLEERCYVLVTAVGAVLDRSTWDPTLPPQRATREAKKLAEAYLAPTLTEPHSSPRGGRTDRPAPARGGPRTPIALVNTPGPTRVPSGRRGRQVHLQAHLSTIGDSILMPSS